MIIPIAQLGTRYDEGVVVVVVVVVELLEDGTGLITENGKNSRKQIIRVRCIHWCCCVCSC